VGHEEIDAAIAWHSVLEREVQLMETWERAVCVVWSWKSPVDSMSGNSNANGISNRNRSTSNDSSSSSTSSSDSSDSSDSDSGSESESSSSSSSASSSSRSSQESRDSRSALSEIFSKLRCHAWSSEDEEKRCRKLGRWSEQEEALLQQIGKRSIALLSEDEQHQSLITILNILFALCYDLRLQGGGEPSPVAAWHLNVLAGSLAGLLTWDRVDAMCQNAHRRSLIYPYLTAWRLTQQVWQDVKCIAYLGRTTMLKYLLMAREICEADEQRKIFCLLFLDDLISFLQQVTFAQLAALWDEIQHVRIEPSHVGLDLDMWHELAASMSRQDLQDADI
jgi:hypothetical protein